MVVFTIKVSILVWNQNFQVLGEKTQKKFYEYLEKFCNDLEKMPRIFWTVKGDAKKFAKYEEYFLVF